MIFKLVLTQSLSDFRAFCEKIVSNPYGEKMTGEAIDAEHTIKKWTRIKKEALINTQWDILKKLAKKKFE